MLTRHLVFASLAGFILAYANADAAHAYQVKIENNTSSKMKVGVYEANEKSYLVALKFFTIAPNKSVTWNRTKNFSVAVFKPGVIDKRLSTRSKINYVCHIKVESDGKKITVVPKKLPTISNDTKGRVKVCLYNPKDVVQGIPFKTWVIDAGQSVSWDSDDRKGACHVKVFEPQAIDLLLVSKNNVPYGAQLKISKNQDGYKL